MITINTLFLILLFASPRASAAFCTAEQRAELDEALAYYEKCRASVGAEFLVKPCHHRYTGYVAACMGRDSGGRFLDDPVLSWRKLYSHCAGRSERLSDGYLTGECP